MTKTNSYSATLNGSTVAFADTSVDYTAWMNVAATRDASDSNYMFVADIWFDDTLGMSDPRNSTGGDIFGVEDGQIVGHEIFGDDWTDGMELLDSIWTASSSLRGSAGRTSLVGVGAAAESTRTPFSREVPTGPIGLANGTLLLVPFSCEDEAKRVRQSFAAYTGGVIGAAGACFLTGPIGCGAGIVAADFLAAYYYSNVLDYVLCLLFGG